MTGKEIRFKRLYKNSERLFVVPMDHGITIGPVAGLENIGQTLKAIGEGGADAVIIHKGLAGQIDKLLGPDSCELIIHLSASTSLAPDPNRKELVTSVEKAIELGATAVSIHVNLGSAFEAEMLKDFGMVAECSNRWGMPLIAMMYIRDGCKENEFHPEKIKHAARVAEEMGADIIKVNYTGDPETFAGVIEGVSAPVIIAGGPKMDSHYELLAMIADAVSAGAGGVAIG
ncbi:MAG TPA: fructose-bisphosphate aldolase, partial [Firmicutes bacterium]|nr:fructose-bisphosphate aldolase [Bacillota bacterium]